MFLPFKQGHIATFTTAKVVIYFQSHKYASLFLIKKDFFNKFCPKRIAH